MTDNVNVLPLRVRMVRPSDIPFITNSWLDSFRNSSLTRAMPKDLYYAYHHKILENILPRSTVVVLCDDRDDNHIIGWGCAEKYDNSLVLHYIYIKQMYRKMRLAKRIYDVFFLDDGETWEPSAVFYTHRSHTFDHINRRRRSKKLPFVDRKYRMLYNPYLLFQSLPDEWDQV